MTLVEVLISVALIAILTGVGLYGVGFRKTAQLKGASVMVAGAVRIAYAHANAISKPVRLVFDFEQRSILLEEASGAMLVVRGDKTGGAQAATETERRAAEEADAILKGPRAPRPMFAPSKAFGFDKGEDGRQLQGSIRFLQIETGHSDEAEVTGRAYLYFWPGGQTERAAIQLTMARSDEPDSDADAMTVVVHPLTGKAEVKPGKASMPRPRDDQEESEREEAAF
jgi:general secretion pathway protein H